jgi:hypothetical protein
MNRSVGLALLAVFVASCAGTAQEAFEPPPLPHLAAHADARIDVARIETGQSRVRLFVRRLPPPERLGLDLSTYTVWIVPRGAAPIAAGCLRYDPQDRHGDATVLTSFDHFRVLVTAEPSPRSGAPSPVIVVDRAITG